MLACDLHTRNCFGLPVDWHQQLELRSGSRCHVYENAKGFDAPLSDKPKKGKRVDQKWKNLRFLHTVIWSTNNRFRRSSTFSKNY